MKRIKAVIVILTPFIPFKKSNLTELQFTNQIFINIKQITYYISAKINLYELKDLCKVLHKTLIFCKNFKGK